MAGRLIEKNTSGCSFIIDNINELDYLPTTTTKGSGQFEKSFDFFAPMGSTCIIGNGSDNVLIYALFSLGWKKIGESEVL